MRTVFILSNELEGALALLRSSISRYTLNKVLQPSQPALLGVSPITTLIKSPSRLATVRRPAHPNGRSLPVIGFIDADFLHARFVEQRMVKDLGYIKWV
ncbi:hypothetical protein V8E55_009504 [Tylopilus felleus]